MSLRIVVLTRSSRPSGAQMVWRLCEAGMAPAAVIVEKRSSMIKGKKSSKLFLLFQLDPVFLWKRIWEAFRIRAHYFLRKYFKGKFRDPVYLSIEELALDYPIRLVAVDHHNGPETRKLLQELQPDIGILTNTRRIRKEVLDIPRHGFFNLHLSALPQYAGLNSIFWALYHGEKEIGVTIHCAAEQIDRGDIILQKKIPVSLLDNEETLYEKALWLGTYLMIKAVRQLEAGMLEKTPQDPSRASYFSWPGPRERALFKARLRRNIKASCDEKENRHVIHVITRMIRGGAQENTLATVRGLERLGYWVTLVTGPTWGKEGELVSEAIENGVDVVIIPELIRELHPWRDFIVFFRLLSLFSRSPNAIIHTHTSKAGFLGRLAARFCRTPVVIHTPHGHVFHSYFPFLKEVLFLGMERLTARWTNRLIALTEIEKQEHLTLGVGKSWKWVTIPSGIDEKRFLGVSEARKQEIRTFLSIPPVCKIVGFVGRLAPVKGPRYFLEAIPKIRHWDPDAYFLFVGDGEERQALEERGRELGLTRNVIWAGHQKQVSHFLALMDILVVPSLNEGMGRVIAEGGLLTKPVVGTKIGGIPDLIEHRETGLLVTPRHAGEIAQAVTELLKDPALGWALGKNLRIKVLSGFTERHMVESIHNLYQQMMNQKRMIQKTPPLQTGSSPEPESAMSAAFAGSETELSPSKGRYAV